jgi:ABC-type uncharacterized transport system auxiliary subunit
MPARLALVGLLGLAACSLQLEPPPLLDVYAIAPVAAPLPPEQRAGGWQVLVEAPDAGGLLAGDRIAVRDRDGREGVLGAGRWNQPLPSLLQALLVRALEDSGAAAAAARAGDVMRGDHLLVADLRVFHVDASGGAADGRAGDGGVEVLVGVRLVDAVDGHVAGSRVFGARADVDGSGAGRVVAAFEVAWARVQADIVVWAAGIGRQRLPAAGTVPAQPDAG